MRHAIALFALLATALATKTATAQVVLSEWLASNRTTLTDRDGAAADWIELHNLADKTAQLEGFYLSDDSLDPTRWRFPAVKIAPRGYLLVYATGKDRRAPEAPLHTNFRLSRGGGQILLVQADGRTIADQVKFGKQRTDVSEGYPQKFKTVTVLPEDAKGAMLVPRSSRSMPWRRVQFDDSGWFQGRSGFGFDLKTLPTFQQWVRTDVAKRVRKINSSIYYRFPIELTGTTNFDACLLRVRCVAGFAAYMNGTEVARRRAPRGLRFDSAADPAAEPRDPSRPDLFGVPAKMFKRGKNLLAIHALTDAADTREHLLEVSIRGYQTEPMRRGKTVFFGRPTPGRPNGEGRVTFVKTPKAKPNAQLFTQSVTVTLVGDAKDAIHYTLDGTIPDQTSPKYTAPLQLDRTTHLRARAFRDGAVASPVTAGVYTRMAADLARFDSNLPLMAITSFGKPIRPKEFETVHVHAVDVAPGKRCSLANPSNYAGFGALKYRGSSTLERPKKAYGLELRKSSGRDRRAELLGLPKDADWVLYGPHNYDQAHLRNALCYELARRIGLDAPRTRFLEVFVNDDGDDLSYADYRGLYILTERISPGKHRVPVKAPGPRDLTEPGISGGYILKIDRPGPGDMGFMSQKMRLQFVYPKERDITDPQRRWLQNHFDRFQTVLASDSGFDPKSGYPAFIDVDNFIDFHFFHEYTKNPDAFTLSTYLHKPRGKRIRMGPVWDFDRALRTNDEDYWVGRPARPKGWTGDSGYAYWEKLFADPNFRRRYEARSFALLRGEYSVAKVHALVDAMAKQIAEAEERDRKRWPIIAPGEWHNEILELKEWIVKRTDWLLTESLEVPQFVSSTGSLAPPTTLSLTVARKKAEIFYTLDGADPRLRDGSLSPRAMRYTGPFRVQRPTRVQTRIRVGNVWGHLAWATVTNDVAKLAISEVMFNPKGGRNYEFLEIVNYGDKPVDLRGIKLTGAARFYFSLGDFFVLAPGKRAVLVRDRQRFADRYGKTGIPIVGEYLGKMDNTEGSLLLTGPIGEEICRAEYRDDWVPEADGKGYSLVTRRFSDDGTNREDWAKSERVFGSPGRE